MKTACIILKILAALAAVAGIVYVIATYGDKIVAWAKGLLGKDSCEECECDEAVEEVEVEEEAVEASEADFEG